MLNIVIVVLKSPLKLARQISLLLGTVPSLIWGLLYLLLISGFATFYTFLPSGSFYHSTITNDVLYKEDKATLRIELEFWANAQLTTRLSEAIENVESKKPRQIRYYAGYSPEERSPSIKVVADFDGNPTLYSDVNSRITCLSMRISCP